MICGHCKNPDVTIVHVKACARVAYAPRLQEGIVTSYDHTAVYEAPLTKTATPVEIFNSLAAQLPNVARAFYAVPKLDGEGFDFFKIDKPQDGKWVGRTFVKRVVSDYDYPMKFSIQLDALNRIVAADPAKALEAYGHELGKCGICSRALTDPESIARGIGPVCAAKL